ncbi:Rrf2 family transcriptional regulator [Xanthobacter dioxanivorans]|uniref:Rrf2 family transcriptional regulator n=1 Tax=Xanthobacter dioxanivorans TaxID=2528964 RepID=A0A974PP66_9HYPH|nr:Rrf2 family transcriptional regulator [Xanthobacter dioxanivorans]QRG07197.1 Rrf2 family transcriptional regulator [Xanthobacter dioxanivorans]
MLTKKGKYGLKAAVFLAHQPEGKALQVAEIADANHIPKKFLDVILGEMRHGGYRLARGADQINVGALIRALDGPLAPLPCVGSTDYQPCPDCDGPNCTIRLLMAKAYAAIREVMDDCSLADLRDISGDRLQAFVDYI